MTAKNDRWSNPRLMTVILVPRLYAGRCTVYFKSQIFVFLESLICLSLKNSDQDLDCSKCPNLLNIGYTPSTMVSMSLYWRTNDFCRLNYLHWKKYTDVHTKKSLSQD